METARSNLGVTELLEQIWAEKALFLSVLHFTSSFVTFQVFLSPNLFSFSANALFVIKALPCLGQGLMALSA
jgi:hypothetical protein